MTNVVVGTRHQVPAISPTTRLSHHHPRVLAFATPPKPAPLADLNCRCQVGPCVSAASATSGCPGYASPLAANGWCAAEPEDAATAAAAVGPSSAERKRMAATQNSSSTDSPCTSRDSGPEGKRMKQ
mmetsp:Transcript_12092/g.26654  ORF Transcript_12092/g.26654 Transcript_12092/m.26654 type:complete len:127 (+) Transcript_12092:336-716(+)